MEAKSNKKVEWKILLDNPKAKMPSFAKPGDAGADLCSAYDYVILPGEVVAVDTGLRWEVPFGYEVQIRPRSGLAMKSKISVLNTPGTIDAAYRGPIKVLLFNYSKNTFCVKSGDKIAQAVISKLLPVSVLNVKQLSDTERGEGGFGSTGT